MKKRRLLSGALIICLIAILACGSLAYFTDTKSVTNKFYTASYDPTNPDVPITAEQVFSIKVYETDANDEEDLDGLEYADILPGAELEKDPTIVNTGKYPAYVRMSVMLTKASAWNAICDEHEMEVTDLFGELNTNWELKTTTEDSQADTIIFVYYLNAPLAAGTESTLFEKVIIPAEMTVEEMVTVSYFEVQITADAIQSDNTGDNAFDTFKDYWEE